MYKANPYLKIRHTGNTPESCLWSAHGIKVVRRSYCADGSFCVGNIEPCDARATDEANLICTTLVQPFFTLNLEPEDDGRSFSFGNAYPRQKFDSQRRKFV
jgi:predicted Ser/Thr protein kinase